MGKNQGCGSQVKEKEGSAPVFPCAASHAPSVRYTRLPHTHTHPHTHTCTYTTHIHTRILACIYTSTHAHLHMQRACTHTHMHKHTYTRILIHTGYPQGTFIPRPPSHMQLQTLFSASVSGLCVLFASPCNPEGGLAGRDWEAQDAAVSSPSTRFASACFEGEVAPGKATGSSGTERREKPWPRQARKRREILL